MKLVLSCLCLGLINFLAAEPLTRPNYDGYRVLRLKHSPQVRSVIDNLNLATWITSNYTNVVDVVVPPGVTALDSIESYVMHKDLGSSISREARFEQYAGKANMTWFNSYHSYNDHLKFLTDLAASYPGNAEVVTSGKSVENRPISGIHIYGTSGKGMPAVVLYGTVHAREWITTMVTEHHAYSLLSQYATDPEVKGWVDKYDFYIFPITNPDGFWFTQNGNRMWRKNRQQNRGQSCVGRDINRNWDTNWNVVGGASTRACADDYKGDAVADAPETRAIAAFTTKLGTSSAGLKLFIDYHSYAQLFMTPYGYTCNDVAANDAVLQSLASGAVSAISGVSGTPYGFGTICKKYNRVTGNSVDYVHDVSKSKHTFTIELRDKGRYGFVLPPDQILPTATEDFAGFKYLLRNI